MKKRSNSYKRSQLWRKPKIVLGWPKSPSRAHDTGQFCERDFFHSSKARWWWFGGSCHWGGFCSHAKKRHLILGYSLVFGHEAGENLKQWLQTVPCSERNNECKKHNPECQAKWLRLILFVITSAERILAARSPAQGWEIHISSTFFCFDN